MTTRLMDMKQRIWNNNLCRIWNNNLCRVKYWTKKPGSWHYGTLYITSNDGVVTATFGDLTIPVNAAELVTLLRLAYEPRHHFTQDLEPTSNQGELWAYAQTKNYTR